MDNTILQQGNFTADGTAKFLAIRSDVDWMMVYNTTIGAANQTTAVATKFYWQRGFADGAKWSTFKSNAAAAANLEQYITSNGFSLIDTSTGLLGTLNATTTAISAAAIPVATFSGISGLSAGDVVRIINTVGAQQLGGFDFTVGHNTLTQTSGPDAGTFSLDYMSQIVAGTTGSWRKVNYDPLFYPRRRYVTKITAASSAVVTLSVKHGYTVGQKVRFIVPAAFGMIEMDGLQGTITAVDTTVTSGNTVTVNIDSSAFTAFAWPLTAAVPFSAAEMVPVGEDTAQALSSAVDILGDATNNTGYIGMKLVGGAGNPGGASSDAMYWVAGKSFSVNNTI